MKREYPGHEQKTHLPPIPAKRYFTIGEVSELCEVKRRGNRRYYQHYEVLLVRRIRELLYEQGFTIHGARNRLNASRSAAVDMSQPMPERRTARDTHTDHPFLD